MKMPKDFLAFTLLTAAFILQDAQTGASDAVSGKLIRRFEVHVPQVELNEIRIALWQHDGRMRKQLPMVVGGPE